MSLTPEQKTMLEMFLPTLDAEAASNLAVARVLCSVFEHMAPEGQNIMFQVLLGQTTGAGFGSENLLITMVDEYPAHMRQACEQFSAGLFERFQANVAAFHVNCAAVRTTPKKDPRVVTIMAIPEDEKGN